MKYGSAREMMQAMNNGELTNRHLGPKNFHILKQEIFSLKNEYNPDTWNEKEELEWNEAMSDRLSEVEQLTSPSQKEELLIAVDKMLKPNA